MSDSSRVQVTFGLQADKSTPATDGEIMYRTGGGGDEPISETGSNQVRADLNDTSLTLTNIGATYQMDTEWLVTGYPVLVKGVLKCVTPGAVVTVVSVAGDVSFVDTNNKLTSTTSGKFDSVPIGAPVYIQAVGAPASNVGWGIVLAKVTGASPSLTIDLLNFTDFTPTGVGFTLKVPKLNQNGSNTEQYFSVEEYFTDLTAGSSRFDQYLSLKIEKMTVSIPLPGVITSQFSFQGLSGVQSITSQFSGTVAPVSVLPISNGARNIFYQQEGGGLVASPYDWAGITFNVNSGARPGGKLGSLNNTRIGSNKFQIDGTFDIYNDENAAALKAKAKAKTPTSLFFVLKDDLGNQEAHWFPYIFLSGAPRNAGGNDAFVMQKMAWKAKMHPTYGYMYCLGMLPVGS